MLRVEIGRLAIDFYSLRPFSYNVAQWEPDCVSACPPVLLCTYLDMLLVVYGYYCFSGLYLPGTTALAELRKLRWAGFAKLEEPSLVET